MATKLNVSENQATVPLRVGSNDQSQTISSDVGNPYYVGARAYVTQLDDGAEITVTDKEGTTTATIHNGQDGEAGATGADGYSPTATVTKSGSTSTITITDKNGTTTAEVYDGESGGEAKIPYYTCSASSSSMMKTLVAVSSPLDAITTGCSILVKFTNGNAVQQPFLSFPDETWIEREIRAGSSSFSASSNPWGAGEIVMLTYDGNYWQLNDWSVGDVRIDGASVVSSGIATIPKAAYNQFGVVEVTSNIEPPAGVLSVTNAVGTLYAPLTIYDENTSSFNPIRPRFLPYATSSSQGAVRISNATGSPREDEIRLYYGSNSSDYYATPNVNNQNGVINRAYLPDATTSAKGAMSASDKTKLDGIESGAEANVQSDWNQSDSAEDDFIKNKPTIPSKTSDLTNDSGFITGYTETDPVFTASAAHGITSSDISTWNGKSTVSVTRHTTSGTNIADLTINGTTTKLYAPQGGGGTLTDVTVDGTSVVSGSVAEIDLTGKADVSDIPTKVSDLTNDSGYITGYTETDPVFSASAAHGITSSNISTWNGKYTKPSGGIPKTDLASAVQTSLGLADTALQSFTETDPTVPSWAKASSKPSYTASEVGAVPTTRTVNGKALSSNITLSASDVSALPSSTVIPTITDTYSGTSSDGMSGKAVKSAIDALDGTITGTAGASKTLTAFSQTDGKVSATFGNISITKSQISDFPTIPTVNNATLTIQKNGTTVNTFTANASSNVTANISVPTKTSDLTNDSGFLTLATLPIYNGGVQ